VLPGCTLQSPLGSPQKSPQLSGRRVRRRVLGDEAGMTE
jgi:hypothetical protein